MTRPMTRCATPACRGQDAVAVSRHWRLGICTSMASVVLVAPLLFSGCATFVEGDGPLAWPQVDYAAVDCNALMESVETLRIEIRRLEALSGGPDWADVPLPPGNWGEVFLAFPIAAASAERNRGRLSAYRAKLAEFERAVQEKGCPGH